ncbi:MAG: hypothetical protein JOY96_10560, partial [Verrucomicrobia bacterium]|nr:hypothetical protein [Verrucomicrobiota bacterium]
MSIFLAMSVADPLQIRSFLVELCQGLHPDFIVIGGWAVYAYSPYKMSLDGDAIISYAAEGTLRDSFEVTKNLRMKKSQFLSPLGIDIDLYVENQHSLPVSFAEAQAYSRQIEGLTVVCPEHLLVMKLRAALQRGTTAKGLKDRQDIIAILDRAEFLNPELFEKHLSNEDWQILHEVIRDSDAVLAYLGGPSKAWQAKQLKDVLT